MESIDNLPLKELVDLLIIAEQKQKEFQEMQLSTNDLGNIAVHVQFGEDVPHFLPTISTRDVVNFAENELESNIRKIKDAIRQAL